MLDLKADLHVHTIASGHAYSTVGEIVSEAKNKGLELIGITDHGPQMPGGPHLYHFGNLRVIPSELEGVEILKGVEANIIDYEGNLDMPERYLQILDVVLAGFHTFCYPGGSIEENTEAMIKALLNPYVDVVVHPGNPEFKVDFEKLVEASTEFGKAIEINNSSFLTSRKGSSGHCKDIIKLVKQKGTKIVVGSDSHIALDVGRFDRAQEELMCAGVSEEQIITSSKAKVKEYLRLNRQQRKNTYL